jgi:hypothetical protein
MFFRAPGPNGTGGAGLSVLTGAFGTPLLTGLALDVQ